MKRPKGADLEIFFQAIQDHQANPDVEKLYGGLEDKYMDTTFPVADGVATWEDLALYSYKERIEKAQVNSYNRVGWIDAGTAEGVLEKFLTFNTPQRIVILPTGHRLGQFVDLYGTHPDREPYQPGFKSPNAEMLDYFATHLKDGAEIKVKRRIIYFTYGDQCLEGNRCLAPERHPGADVVLWRGAFPCPYLTRFCGWGRYLHCRFHRFHRRGEPLDGQMGCPVKYGDRWAEDEKLLHYTSAPLETDLEITGSPTVSLQVASTHADGAFHVYLEDVAPDGRVTYLTEGLLRAIHRKVKDPKTAPYAPLGVYHSLRKVDAQPLVPGEVAEISITLYPISVLICKEHRIRLAIAGHDASLKTRYPPEGIPELHFQRNSAHASYVQLPVMERELL